MKVATEASRRKQPRAPLPQYRFRPDKTPDRGSLVSGSGGSSTVAQPLYASAALMATTMARRARGDARQSSDGLRIDALLGDVLSIQTLRSRRLS